MRPMNRRVGNVGKTSGGAPIPPPDSPAVKLSKRVVSVTKWLSKAPVDTPDIKQHQFNKQNHDKFDQLL